MNLTSQQKYPIPAFFKNLVSVMDGSPKVFVTTFEWCTHYYPSTPPYPNPNLPTPAHLLFLPPTFVSFVFTTTSTTLLGPGKTARETRETRKHNTQPQPLVIWHHLSITKYLCATFFWAHNPITTCTARIYQRHLKVDLISPNLYYLHSSSTYPSTPV